MNIKSFDTLGKRIEFLLDLKEIKKQELADAINLNPATISNYISGKRNPDVDTLKKIADFFNVSLDYLLCTTNDPTKVGEKNELYERLCCYTKTQQEYLLKIIDDIEKYKKSI